MRPCLSLCAGVALAASLHPAVRAQTAPAKPPASEPAAPQRKRGAPASKESDPDLAAKRTLALSLLTSLADEARSYDDLALRARVQSRVADALWEQAPERARDLFRRAWEAAEAAEGSSSADGGGPSRPGRFGKNPGASPARGRTNLRMEVLGLAARRDGRLGREFLERLTAGRREEAGRQPSAAAGQELSEAAIKIRLRLAGEFLESNDVERAMEFADPALVRVSDRVVQFLVELREKNAAAADSRFASLLARAAADPYSDANTVSLLTSYAFTPSTYLTVSETGIPSSMNFDPRPAPDLAPALRASFFRFAADVLLRPSAQLDRTTAGRAGTYYIVARLLPLFERHAPELAPSLGAQLAALRPDAPQRLTEGGDPSLDRGIDAGGSRGDRVQEELDRRLGQARGADERDRAYAFAAVSASESGDRRAYEFLEKIEDTETQRGVRSLLDYTFISALLRKKEWEEAARMARKSELAHAQRVYVFTRAAALASKSEAARSRELLEEALAEARRLDAGAERAYSLVAVSAGYSKVDVGRAWELAAEMVKAADAADGFTGEDGRVFTTLEGKFSYRAITHIASAQNFSELFYALADNDLVRAAQVARNFQQAAPRALAVISVARSVLDTKRTRPVP